MTSSRNHTELESITFLCIFAKLLLPSFNCTRALPPLTSLLQNLRITENPLTLKRVLSLFSSCGTLFLSLQWVVRMSLKVATVFSHNTSILQPRTDIAHFQDFYKRFPTDEEADLTATILLLSSFPLFALRILKLIRIHCFIYNYQLRKHIC